MLSIDPERVDQASSLLRSVADLTDDMFGDIQQGGHASHVWPSEQRTLLEIGEEVDLLASTLTYRAELARGHTLGLAGIGLRFGMQHAEGALFESLGDDQGFSNLLAGDLSLSYIADNFARFDLNGDGSLETGELNNLLANPAANLSATDRAAIRTLTNRFIEWPSVTSEDLATLLAQNEMSRLLDPSVAKLAQTHTDTMTVDEMRLAIIGVNPELEDQINALFEDQDAAMLYFNGADRVNLDALLARSINLGAYSHSGTLANTFLRSLPSGADRKPGIDINLVSDDGLVELFTVAAASLPDPLAVVELVPFLPESRGGIRNGLISWAYGFLETQQQQIQSLFHPDHVGVPGFGGNGWTAFGASASHSVGAAIRGEESYVGVSITSVMSQSFADGNQDIAADAIPLFAEIVRMHRFGPPTDEAVREFLAGFVDGQAEMRTAAAKLIESFASSDPETAQRLQIESNMLFTIHEQAVVNDDLSFRQMAMWQRIGARLTSGVVNCVTPDPGGDVDPADECETRSGGGILTDTGMITVQISENEQLEIPLHQIYTDGDRSRNLLNGLTIDELDLDLQIEGYSDLAPVGEVEGVRFDPPSWTDDEGDLVAGSDWSVPDQRMPQIAGVVMNGSSDPVFAIAADYHTRRGPVPGRDLKGDWGQREDWFEWKS